MKTKVFRGAGAEVQQKVERYFDHYRPESYGTHISKRGELPNGDKFVVVVRAQSCN